VVCAHDVFDDGRRLRVGNGFHDGSSFSRVNKHPILCG
jgi:hypothetical protein